MEQQSATQDDGNLLISGLQRSGDVLCRRRCAQPCVIDARSPENGESAKRLDKLLTKRRAENTTGYLLAMPDESRIITLIDQLGAA
ncbi:hypothetical protein, partial [Bradyrhizobium sp. JYMT SZCCT0428]|uniref:hypothetical protein n=1 Tax=Bradyrhizobium sp. JYMT SZCCT0428 TaxID=2807673 RepID=UPI001BA751FD